MPRPAPRDKILGAPFAQGVNRSGSTGFVPQKRPPVKGCRPFGTKPVARPGAEKRKRALFDGKTPLPPIFGGVPCGFEKGSTLAAAPVWLPSGSAPWGGATIGRCRVSSSYAMPGLCFLGSQSPHVSALPIFNSWVLYLFSPSCRSYTVRYVIIWSLENGRSPRNRVGYGLQLG